MQPPNHAAAYIQLELAKEEDAQIISAENGDNLFETLVLGPH